MGGRKKYGQILKKYIFLSVIFEIVCVFEVVCKVCYYIFIYEKQVF